MNALEGINEDKLRIFLNDKLGDFLNEDLNSFFKENGELDQEKIDQIDRVYSNIFVKEYKSKEEFEKDLNELLLHENESSIDLFFSIIRYVLGEKYVIKEEDLKLHSPKLLSKEDYLKGEYYRYNTKGMSIILGRNRDYLATLDEIKSMANEIVECQDVKSIELSDLYPLIKKALGENIETLKYIGIPQDLSLDGNPKDLQLVDEILMSFYNKLSSLYDENKISIYQGETANHYFDEFLKDGLRETLGTYSHHRIQRRSKDYKNDTIKYNTTFEMNVEDLNTIMDNAIASLRESGRDNCEEALKKVNNAIKHIKIQNPDAFQNVDISESYIRKLYEDRSKKVLK